MFTDRVICYFFEAPHLIVTIQKYQILPRWVKLRITSLRATLSVDLHYKFL